MVDVSNQILRCVDLGKTHLPHGGVLRSILGSLKIHLSQASIWNLEGELFVVEGELCELLKVIVQSCWDTSKWIYPFCFILLCVQHKGLSHERSTA